MLLIPIDYFAEGIIALEHSVIAGTLTPDEDLIYQLRFMSAMVTGNNLIKTTFAGVMHFEFLEDSDMDYYKITTIEKVGVGTILFEFRFREYFR